MQVTKYNNINVTPSPSGENRVVFRVLGQEFAIEAERWDKNENITLYKVIGNRIIVAVPADSNVICDGETWSIYGDEYRHAQRNICLRHGLKP